MDQSIAKHQNSFPANQLKGLRIAYIQAGWHHDIVSQAYDAFIESCEIAGLARSEIELVEVPGSLEIPLQAKLLANSGNYAVVLGAGLIVDGGIYRHDFVAASVLQGMMQVQLETEVPVLSLVLTPHQFQETEAHEQFFREHFQVKGREAAQACLQTLHNMAKQVRAA